MDRPLNVDGRNIRIDPLSANAATLGVFTGMQEGFPENKLEEVKKGALTQRNNPPFPDSRPCRDALWFLLFVITVVLTLGMGYASSDKLESTVSHHRDKNIEGMEFPPGKILSACVMNGTVASMLMAFAYVMLAHRAPACVVWTSLLFSPCFMIGSGVIMMLGIGYATSDEDGVLMGMIGGFILVAIGLCQLACVWCWRHFIPFTITVTETVSEVIEDHPCLLVVSLIGAVLSFLWTISCAASFVAIYLENQEMLSSQDRRAKYVGVGVTTFIFAWGALVVVNVCHLTYAGVFGRWYYDQNEGSTLMPSLKVSTTTSVGSVCMGSFLVAIIRAVYAIVDQVQKDAQEDGNPVLCVVACIAKMIIDCIGDILEYFNEWAYIQCAVRGTSFVTSASITYSMMTCANMKYLLADLLLDSVASFGSIFCALAGAAAGAGTGWVMDGVVAAVWGGVIGLMVGIMAGSAALSIISSGVKTILACWADDPEPLHEKHEEIAAEFADRIAYKMSRM